MNTVSSDSAYCLLPPPFLFLLSFPLSLLLHTLSLTHTHTHTHTHIQRRYSGCSEPQTNLDLSLTTAHLNADVTLLDRLQPLLTSPLRSQYNSLRSGGTLGQTMKHSLYMTSSNYHMVNLVSLFVWLACWLVACLVD